MKDIEDKIIKKLYDLSICTCKIKYTKIFDIDIKNDVINCTVETLQENLPISFSFKIKTSEL